MFWRVCGVWVGKRSVLYIPHFFALITLNLITLNPSTRQPVIAPLMIPKHLGAVMSSRKPTNLIDRVTLAFIVIGSAAFFLATLLYNSELCLP